MKHIISEQKEPVEGTEPGIENAKDSEEILRREALAILARHSAFTAPAVLAILSTTTKRVAAGSF